MIPPQPEGVNDLAARDEAPAAAPCLSRDAGNASGAPDDAIVHRRAAIR